MSKKPDLEKVTIHGKNIVIKRDISPIENAGIAENADMFKLLNIFDAKFQPANYNKADGTPLRLYDADHVKIDLSKRSKEDMGFWHRNVDWNEIIFCVKGALRWETEITTLTLHPGEMILIPKGIAHRSMLCDESEEENVLLELKISDELVYVGDNK
ncbi:MAG: hypothetical protein OES26_05010 [Gammaproteobacteria bacterium]|nr:hypothetical protein [Gammaproteobacteria bacterium]